MKRRGHPHERRRVRVAAHDYVIHGPTGEEPAGFVMLFDESLGMHPPERPQIGIWVSYVPGEGSPEAFYLSAGFKHTGRVDDGEVVLELPLQPAARSLSPEA